MIKITLSVIISIVLFVVGIADNLSWGESTTGFCFDEVGDNQFCFNDEKDCNESKRGTKWQKVVVIKKTPYHCQ